MKEIIIIETNHSQKIKNFLDQEHCPYKIYQEPSEKIKESIFASYDKVLQDKDREKEAEELENSEEEDIINDEW